MLYLGLFGDRGSNMSADYWKVCSIQDFDWKELFSTIVITELSFQYSA